MKLVAAICYWDETDEMRERCLDSLHGVVDDVIFHHEAFRGFPGATTWARTQIQARAELMAEAAACGDWTLVLDMDEVVSSVQSAKLRLALELTELHVATVSYTDVGGHPETYPRLYRALPDLTVKDRHNGYWGNGGFLHGWDYRALDPNQVLDCTRWLAIRHDTNQRTYERTQAQLAYRRARAEQGER